MKKIATLVGLLAALVSPAFAEPIFSSSATATADTAKTLRTGRFELYKVLVSSPGASGSSISITNGGTTIMDLDASAIRDVKYQIQGSSNIIYTTAGSPAPEVQILWSPGYQSEPGYSVYHSTGTWTLKNVFRGRALIKKIIVDKPVAETSMTVYDSNAIASHPVANLGTYNFSDQEYNVLISSGLTITTTGLPGVSILYKRY